MSLYQRPPIRPDDIQAAVIELFSRKHRGKAIQIAKLWAKCWDEVGREDLAHMVRVEITRH